MLYIIYRGEGGEGGEGLYEPLERVWSWASLVFNKIWSFTDKRFKK